MHRFYAPDVMSSSAELRPDEARHLSRVLRLGAGAEVVVFDGRGGEWRARISHVRGDDVRVELIEPRVAAAEPSIAVTLAVALLKGDDMDAVVRDATSLGVVAIAPFVSSHTVVPAAARQAGAVERWTRIAVASAKQCGRAVLPRIDPCRPFANVLAGEDGLKIFCLEPEKAEGLQTVPPERPNPVVICVGPEGGWSDEEIERARQQGAAGMTLGPRTLRAGVIPTVALTSLWTRWGWT